MVKMLGVRSLSRDEIACGESVETGRDDHKKMRRYEKLVQSVGDVALDMNNPFRNVYSIIF